MDTMFGHIDIVAYLDVSVILFLLAAGFLIKHMTKIDNKYIPWVLLLLSLAIESMNNAITNTASVANIIINSIISTAIAVYLHTSGKSVLKYVDILKNTETDEPDSEDEEDDEEDSDDDN